MPEKITALKSYLINNPKTFQDRAIMKAILNDLFRNQLDMVNILPILYFELNIHQEILNTTKHDIFFKSRIALKLKDSHRIDLEAARNAVDIWVECLRGIPIPTDVENIEPAPPQNLGDLYFPCGVSHHDYGFYVHGIENSDGPCEHPQSSIFAVIFNYLQRAIDMKPGQIYRSIEEKHHVRKDYRRVYRLQILILLLVKNNYFNNNKLKTALIGWSQIELGLALDSINRYSDVICTLSVSDFQKLQIIVDSTAPIKICDSNRDGFIGIINSESRASKKRIIWNESNIQYSISEENRGELELLLQEGFSYNSFLNGQFEAIKEILNSEDSKLCIMPTGSGKSLIYYIAALLQPCPTMVLCPTKILIMDQIDILKNKHYFDDIQFLQEYDNHENFHPSNKLIFLTPLTFLSSDLIKNLISLDVNQQIANFVLDEVHCISNWSHDFRPEYLMLSFNIKTFAERTRLVGFSATANYTVVKDLIFQLSLESDGKDIIAPLDLSKPNQQYLFNTRKSNDECLHSFTEKVHSFLLNETAEKNRQLLVFTKNKLTSDYLSQSLPVNIQPEVEIYSSLRRESFSDFASSRYKVLIGGSEVGIGINLPGVTDTYHYGIPISKSQYVQEIGRAGRDDKKAFSEVTYLARESLTSEQNQILHRNTPISTIIRTIHTSDKMDDITLSFHKIFGGIESQEEYTSGVISIYKKILPISGYAEVKLIIDKSKTYDECLSQYMRYLYVLYRIGYIYNWYIADHSTEDNFVTFLIEIAHYTDLETLKNVTKYYLLKMGDYKKAVWTIQKSTTVEEIISNYISWHFNQFLYHHREQFMDMYDFLELNKGSTNQQISYALREYFSLSLLDVREDASRINLLTIKDILQLLKQGVSSKVVSDIQKSMENEYSSKHDFLLLLNNYRESNRFDLDRFERIAEQLSEVDFRELLSIIDQIYSGCSDVEKTMLINILCRRTSLNDVLNSIYNKLDEDIVYFCILSKCCNFNFARLK